MYDALLEDIVSVDQMMTLCSHLLILSFSYMPSTLNNDSSVAIAAFISWLRNFYIMPLLTLNSIHA